MKILNQRSTLDFSPAADVQVYGDDAIALECSEALEKYSDCHSSCRLGVFLGYFWSTFGVLLEYFWGVLLGREYFWSTFGVLLEYFWSTFGEYFRLLLEYITQIRHALFPRGRPHSPWMEVVGAPVRLLFILANSIWISSEYF